MSRLNIESKATQTDLRLTHNFTSVGCQTEPSGRRGPKKKTSKIKPQRPTSPQQLKCSIKKGEEFHECAAKARLCSRNRTYTDLNSHGFLIPSFFESSTLDLTRNPVRLEPVKITKRRCAQIVLKDFTPTDGNKCNRTPATTTLFPSRQLVVDRVPTLFQDDLINIISKNHEKRLQMLYKSPITGEIPSIMNLLPSPTSRGKTVTGDIHKPPWK